MTEDIENLIRVDLPVGALAATPSGYCLTLTRNEAVALLGSSERFREATPLLGQAVMRAEAERSFRRRTIEIANLSEVEEIVIVRRRS